MHTKYQEEGQIYKFSIKIISITRIRENRRTQKILLKRDRNGYQLTNQIISTDIHDASICLLKTKMLRTW